MVHSRIPSTISKKSELLLFLTSHFTAQGFHFLGNQTENCEMEENKNGTKVTEISPSSSEKVERRIIPSSSPFSGEEDESPIKTPIFSSSEKVGRRIIPSSSPFSGEEDESPIKTPIFCVKRDADIKRIEEIEDCFILDFDPFDSIDLSKLSITDAHSELSVVAEKGQVACRDYPHSRHLCLKFPFETTPHENYCKLCYCYVCDSAAPCKSWMEHEQAHCHASEHVGDWKSQRNSRKKLPAVSK